MGGSYQTTVTVTNNLAPIPRADADYGSPNGPGWAPGLNSPTTWYQVDPHLYAVAYLGMTEREFLAPIGGSLDYQVPGSNADYLDDQGKLHSFPVFRQRTYATENENETTSYALMSKRGRNGDPLIKAAITLCDRAIRGEFIDGTDTNFTALLAEIDALYDHDIMNFTENQGKTLFYYNAPDGPLYLTSVTAQRWKDRLHALMIKDNFDLQRKIQDAMLNVVIDLGKQSVMDAELLRMAGVYDRLYRHGEIEDKYKLWYDDYTGWIRRTEILGNGIRTLVGSVETTTRRFYKPSPVMGIIGGVATAAVGVATGNPLAVVQGVMGAAGSAMQ